VWMCRENCRGRRNKSQDGKKGDTKASLLEGYSLGGWGYPGPVSSNRETLWGGGSRQKGRAGGRQLSVEPLNREKMDWVKMELWMKSKTRKIKERGIEQGARALPDHKTTSSQGRCRR